MTDVKRNIWLKVLTTLIESVAYAMATGTLMQVFLNSIGFSASQIYLHTTINQAAQVIIHFTCSRVGDRGNIFKRFSLLIMAQGASFLFYIPLCIRMQADLGAYLLLLATGVLNTVAGGLGGLLSYKIPYLIYRVEDYGTVTAACGVLSSLVSIGVGVGMAALAERYTYKVIMPWAFPIAAVLIIASGLMQLYYRPLIDPATIQEERSAKKADWASIWQVISQPMFYQLAIPGMLRGFSGGMVGVIAVVAAADLGYSEQVTTTLVSVRAAANMIGCLAFGFLSRKANPRHTIFISSLSFVCLPLLLIPNSPIFFLIMSAVVFFGYQVELSAVPNLLLRIIPGKNAGPYNAYRLLLNHVGALLATGLAAVLPSSVMLLMAMVFQIVSGACYCFLPVVRKAALAIRR